MSDATETWCQLPVPCHGRSVSGEERSAVRADGWPATHAIVAAFGLGEHPGELLPVEGAWSNRLFRLAVGTEVFAVKELRNPWGNPRWLEWLDAAWAFEVAALAAGVDAPEPMVNPENDHCLAWWNARVMDLARRFAYIGGSTGNRPTRVRSPTMWPDGRAEPSPRCTSSRSGPRIAASSRSRTPIRQTAGRG